MMNLLDALLEGNMSLERECYSMDMDEIEMESETRDKTQNTKHKTHTHTQQKVIKKQWTEGILRKRRNNNIDNFNMHYSRVSLRACIKYSNLK